MKETVRIRKTKITDQVDQTEINIILPNLRICKLNDNINIKTSGAITHVCVCVCVRACVCVRPVQ